jgi:hypothetical protein
VKGASTNLYVEGLDDHTAMVSPELLQGQDEALKGGNIDGLGQKRLQNDVDQVLYGGAEKAPIILKRQDDSE